MSVQKKEGRGGGLFGPDLEAGPGELLLGCYATKVRLTIRRYLNSQQGISDGSGESRRSDDSSSASDSRGRVGGWRVLGRRDEKQVETGLDDAPVRAKTLRLLEACLKGGRKPVREAPRTLLHKDRDEEETPNPVTDAPGTRALLTRRFPFPPAPAQALRAQRRSAIAQNGRGKPGGVTRQCGPRPGAGGKAGSGERACPLRRPGGFARAHCSSAPGEPRLRSCFAGA